MRLTASVKTALNEINGKDKGSKVFCPYVYHSVYNNQVSDEIPSICGHGPLSFCPLNQKFLFKFC